MSEISDFTRDDAGNITIKQGKTINWEYRPLDENGDPVDTTGLTARLQVRPSYNSSTILLNLTTENGGIENDGTGFIITINPAQTAYGAGTGIRVTGESLQAVFDMEVVDSSVSPATVTCYDGPASFTILREVTREL